MEYTLTDAWSFTVGTTSKGTLGLIPSASTKTSRVAIVDNDGVLTCKAIKNDTPSTVFTTEGSRKGTSLVVVKDRIFFATGHEVRGFSKKGKNFYNIETFMSEDITSMAISGSELRLAGEHLCSHYLDNREMPYYSSPAKINDLITIRLPTDVDDPTYGGITPNSPNLVMLACADRAIRVVEGRNVISELLFEKHCPMVIKEYVPKFNNGYVLYGSDTGAIGLVQFGLETGGMELWVLDNLPGNSIITALDYRDVTGNGCGEILTGRKDGQLIILSIGEDPLSEPEVIVQKKLRSAITGVAAAPVSKPDRIDVVVSTYAGEVAGLFLLESHMHSTLVKEFQGPDKIVALENELAELTALKDNLNRHLHGKRGSKLALPIFDATDSIRLDGATSTQHLSIETAVSLDSVIIKCDKDIRVFLDQDSGEVAVSIEEENGSVIALFSCQSDVTKLNIRLTTTENKPVMIEAFILSRTVPKVCLSRRYELPALSLHEMTSIPFDENRPINTLTITGDFEFAQISAWIAKCCPDALSTRPEAGCDEVKITFTNQFTGTNLECAFGARSAHFRSDNVSTLSVIKDVVSSSATAMKIRVQTSSTTAEGTAQHTISLLLVRFENLHNRVKQISMLKSTKELLDQESSSDCLSPEQSFVLEHATEIEMQKVAIQSQYECMRGVIVRLFMDCHKFVGIDAKKKLPHVVDVLDNLSDLGSIYELFSDEELNYS